MVTNTPDDGGLQNILLSLQPDNTYKEFLIHYDITDEEILQLYNGEEVNLANRFTMVEIHAGFTEDLFLRVVYEDECSRLDYTINTCPSGRLIFGDTTCSYLKPENSHLGTPAIEGGFYTTTLKPCDMPSGGNNNNNNTNNTSDNWPHGIGSGNNSSSPTTCSGGKKCVPVDTTPAGQGTDPCVNLKNQIDPTKANIKPAIVELQGNLNLAPETGKSLRKDQNNLYSNPDLPTITGGIIKVKYAEYYYGSIHVHPSHGIPMFSWADVFSLLKFYDNATFGNQQEVTIILICKDGSGLNQVYSLNIDDRQAFADAIFNEVAAIPNVGNMNLDQIQEYMDKELTNFYSNNTNKELAFLNRFANFGISLYKANSNITNWSKLTPNNPNTNPPVTQTPCN